MFFIFYCQKYIYILTLQEPLFFLFFLTYAIDVMKQLNTFSRHLVSYIDLIGGNDYNMTRKIYKETYGMVFHESE